MAELTEGGVKAELCWVSWTEPWAYPSITEGLTDPIAGLEDGLRDQGNNGGLAEQGETREREDQS